VSLIAAAAMPDAASPQRHIATPDGRGVNIVGYLQAETGMGEGGRTLIRALDRVAYPTSYAVLQSHDGARQADHTIRGAPAHAPYPVSVFYTNADQVDVIHAELGPAFFAGRYNIGFWSWELETLPATLRRFDFFDEIWTNSRFVQEALASLSPVPVVNVRLPISAPARPAEPMRARLGLPEDRAVFLFAFDALSILPRKNPMAVVEAFRRAFGDASREACLAIKASRLDAFPAEHRELADAVRAVGGRLFDTYLDRQTLSGLFHACDAYVSLHRSEGFGLTMAEAMAIGKPVIATGYSGNMDFMTIGNSYPVRHTRTTLDRPHGPYPQGAVWAEPDVDHAAELMRAVVEHPEEARSRGMRAAADLAMTHGAEVVGGLLTSRLSTIYETRLSTRVAPRLTSTC
jgi:glycosyltransferase involved in cell wall biosynthesis